MAIAILLISIWAIASFHKHSDNLRDIWTLTTLLLLGINNWILVWVVIFSPNTWKIHFKDYEI
jgi:hypothetical protein